ncbi:MAG TPA: AraC family transcriptional regulator [Caulobacteraceae bacterium]|nr:AraC family transcriptional regulator [Caulobacteraceae bacterium]
MTDSAIQSDPLERAQRHIDAHLFEPLTLGALAEAARLSAYHFTREFGARFGLSPMAYVRARRLVAAASRLASGAAPPLVELAFECGFDSQEGFTRAFKRAFGVPPGRYRRSDTPTRMETIAAMTERAQVRISVTQSPEPVRKGRLRIAGFAAVFNLQDKAGIPGLWERLVPMLPLPGQAAPETFGVCAAAPAAAEPGSMRYLAGALLAPDAPAPDDLDVIELAPQAYLVFRQVMDGGPVHPQMDAAAKEIWGERLPRCGRKLVQAPDLEFYPADSTPDQAGAWVEWWVPVEA